MSAHMCQHITHRPARAPLRQRMVTPRAQIEAQTQVSRRAFVAVATLMAASPAYASTLDPAFVQETRILSATINDYMTLDPFDKQRIQALNDIKSEGKAWIAAHAKGGSAPGQAAKRMYVAVDAVLGHVASNGAAPLPKQKVKFVAKTLEEVETLLAQGK